MRLNDFATLGAARGVSRCKPFFVRALAELGQTT
jgi:hypothetical protein